MKKFLFQIGFIVCVFNSYSHAQIISDEKETSWHHFKKSEFKMDGISAWYVKPKMAVAGNPWIWRAQDGSLTEFTIAGADQKFVAAQATIGGNSIVVWSSDIRYPVAVRFGWKNVPKDELYNKAGLPASPFRTDAWPGETVGKK